MQHGPAKVKEQHKGDTKMMSAFSIFIYVIYKKTGHIISYKCSVVRLKLSMRYPHNRNILAVALYYIIIRHNSPHWYTKLQIP